MSVPISSSNPIDHGVPGQSAQREFERRVAKRERAIEEKWGTGRVGRLAKVFTGEPQSTTAWAQGSVGEHRLGLRLSRDLADIGVVLHDRAVPGTKWNIDHLVIAPCGIWVVDAKNYKGRISRRDDGELGHEDPRVYVDGKDRTKLVSAMSWQTDTVQPILESIGFGDVPIHQALCFTDSEWSFFAKPFQIDDVWIIWAKRLVELAREPGPLDDQDIRTIATQLADRLPPA
ncbi:MAG: NERD domain-containing protein [Actinobacteria bacterium]|nr:NERD domain-containing protein [Actinomycetota bacterium]